MTIPTKRRCLWDLSSLANSVGNSVERKRVLTHALKLSRKRGDDHQVAQTLAVLSDTNREMDLREEGIPQAKEASEIFERFGDTASQVGCLVFLASMLCNDNQLDAAEEAASRAIDLLDSKGPQPLFCDAHRALAEVHSSKGNTKKALHHYEVALGIASSLNHHAELFWIYLALSQLSSKEGRSNDAHAFIERAKSHTVNNPYLVARASLQQVKLWCSQNMFQEAKSEALHALDVFEELGATENAEYTRGLLRAIEPILELMMVGSSNQCYLSFLLTSCSVGTADSDRWRDT
jgi:tetratricopeptide (TPR) repeat protein